MGLCRPIPSTIPTSFFLTQMQNAIGRFVAFPVVDKQASADINFNTTKLAAATKDFTGANDLSDTIRRLQSNGTEKLVGNKGFWASDYMVMSIRFCMHLPLLTGHSRTIGATPSCSPTK